MLLLFWFIQRTLSLSPLRSLFILAGTYTQMPSPLGGDPSSKSAVG